MPISFLSQNWLYLIPAALFLLPLLALAAARRRRCHRERLLGARNNEQHNHSPAARAWRTILLIGCILFLILAAARPWRGRIHVQSRTHGRDVVVVCDVSKSMLATDLPPTRLTHAQHLMRKLVQNSTSNRLALIPFAGRAFTACPLTADLAGFTRIADSLNVDTVPVGGTNLEAALQNAMRVLDTSAGHQAIVLLTDGDELEGNVAGTLDALREHKIPLFIFGLGNPAIHEPLPDGAGGFRRDRAGKIITSRLNEDLLRKLAAESGGMYVRSTAVDSGMHTIAPRINRLGTQDADAGVRDLPHERIHLFLCAAGVLLFLYLLLPETRRTCLTVLLFACTFSAGATEDAQTSYNRALKLHSDGNIDKATGAYENAIRHGVHDQELRGRSYFNLAAARHRTAREHYRKALEELKNEQREPALQTLEKALRELAAAHELYATAFSHAATGIHAENLQLHANHQQAMEELKAKIEQLNEQEKKLRNDTKKAHETPTPENASRAGDSAEKLRRQAGAMRQSKLEQEAQKAKEQLEQAAQKLQQGHESEGRRLLEQTSRQLERDASTNAKGSGREKATAAESSGAPPVAGGEGTDRAAKEPPPGQNGAEQLLDILNGKEKELRERIRRTGGTQHREVEKDW